MVTAPITCDELFAGYPVMAILRGLGPERTVELATRAWSLGIRQVEVPLQSADDEAALRTLARRAREEGRAVGAGTVLTVEHVRLAADCGAAFTVSPGFDHDVVRASLDAGMPTLPGVATATEIQWALKAGLTWVKAFPARELGPSWFRSIRGPFPNVHFVATGGIGPDTVGEFLGHGADVVAIGSALADPSALELIATAVQQHQQRQA